MSSSLKQLFFKYIKITKRSSSLRNMISKLTAGLIFNWPNYAACYPDNSPNDDSQQRSLSPSLKHT